MKYDEVLMKCVIEFGDDGNPERVVSCGAKGEHIQIESKAFVCALRKSKLTCKASRFTARSRGQRAKASFQLTRPVIDADLSSDPADEAAKSSK